MSIIQPELRALAEGLLLGTALSVMIGPVFLLIIQTSITKGVSNGMLTAFGALTSDIVIFVFCLHGFRLADSDSWVWITGFIVLVVMGLNLLFRPKDHYLSISDKNCTTPMSGTFSFMQGFTINAFNPFVFAFWVGITVMMNERFHDTQNALTFIAGMSISSGALNVLKAMLPQKVKALLSPRNLRIISQLCGAALVVFALLLGIKMLW